MLGKIFKFLFLLFNLVMLGVLIWLGINAAQIASESDAPAAVGILGGIFGLSILLPLWASGAIILGLLALVFRSERDDLGY